MILFLHGSDTYRSREKLREIRQKFRKEVDPQGYNLTQISGKSQSVAELLDAVFAAPFLAEKRMVIVEELSAMKLSDKEEESLVDAFERLLEQDTIFVVWEEELGKRDLKKPIFTALAKTKYVLSFPAWDTQQVAGWMNQQLQQAQISIAGDALQALSLSVGENLWLASSEVKKLIAYANANNLSQLDGTQIALLTSTGSQDNMFALVDEVSQRHSAQALRLLHDQIDSGSAELQILSMLSRQYRLLQQVKEGSEAGLPPESIAKQYGMHPYVAKKMSGQAKQASFSHIRAAFHLLGKTDKAIKSSGVSGSTLLSTTVAKLSL